MALSRKEEVIQRLFALDFELGQLSPRKEPITLIIFGGTAVLLLSDALRSTRDIDAYIFGNLTAAEHQLLHRYDINDRLKSGTVPEDFPTRVKYLNLSFQRIKVGVADEVDVIIHKLLNRADNRDIEDVFILMENVDLVKLRELYNEYREYAIGNPTRFWDIEDLIEQFKKRKPA